MLDARKRQYLDALGVTLWERRAVAQAVGVETAASLPAEDGTRGKRA